MHRFQLLALVLMMAATPHFNRAASPVDVSAAVTWFDTLGYPDTKATPICAGSRLGSWIQTGGQTPENRFVEGFLVGKEPGAFTVYICSIADFKDRFSQLEPYPAMTTVHFVQKLTGPVYSHIDYEVLDFQKVSSEALDRVSKQASTPQKDGGGLEWGHFVGTIVRIFAFARACMQSLTETGSALMDFAANIPDEQNGKVEPAQLRDFLQQQLGDAALTEAEGAFGDQSKSWSDLLKAYEGFDKQFPANHRVAYARESVELLQKMIVAEAAHHPKPLDQMSPDEQVAEYIYQLQNLKDEMWIMYGKYPDDASTPDGKQILTPVDRLVDLGPKAVPQLIVALDDRRFTHRS